MGFTPNPMLLRHSKLASCALLLSSLLAASAHGFEADTSSNAIFDLYFFGNGEAGQLGENLAGITNDSTGLDIQQIAGWVNWSEGETESSQSYWTAEQKQAVVEAVNAWTAIIGNTYDRTNRKMRIGFYLDDGSRDGSQMGNGMTGYASYATTTATPSGNNPTNIYSVVEWLWRDGRSANVTPPSGSVGSFWNDELLPDQADCIEVAIVLNPETLVISNGTATTTPTAPETLKKVVMHELGHAMGMDSKLFTAGGYPTHLATTWDSLLMLGENQHIVTLDETGKLIYTYESFDALCAAGWEMYQTYSESPNGEEMLLRVQNKNDEIALVLVTAGTNIAGNSLVHLLGDLGVSEHEDVLGPSGIQGSVFTQLDLIAIQALGWQVIPEPSAFGLLAGLSALALGATRRKRKNA